MILTLYRSKIILCLFVFLFVPFCGCGLLRDGGFGGGRLRREACEADVAVDALRRDARTASTDARPVTSSLALINRNVWQVRNNPAIHSTCIEVRIDISSELQFDVAVNPVQRDAFLIDFLQTHDH